MNEKNHPEKVNDIFEREQTPASHFGDLPPAQQNGESADGFLEDADNGQLSQKSFSAAEQAGNSVKSSQEAEKGHGHNNMEDGKQEDKDGVIDEKDHRIQKRQAPKVSPSTMVLTFVFALIFLAAAYFFPYIEGLLPWGGTTIQGSLTVEEYTYDQLIEKAYSVVVGEVGEKRDNIIQYRQTADGLGFIIYSEVDIKVNEVLYGEPYIDEEGVLVTYELGGRREFSQNGRPQIIKVEYDGAAELSSGEKVILFLDDQNNILGEKYGVYRQHSDNFYYDESQAVYSMDGIRSDLILRQN